MAVHSQSAKTSQELRLRIAKELRRQLRPVFKDREVIRITQLLDTNGDPWETTTGDPEQTEAFQDAISDFIHGQIEPLSDYLVLRASYSRWTTCTQILGYLALGVLIFQSIVFLGLGGATKILTMTPTAVWASVTLVPTIVAAIAYFVLGGVRFWSSNTLIAIARKYD
ncbi:hypothetical protein GC197_18405 [bacterium]|nr:hypothetical protein [bacterium]